MRSKPNSPRIFSRRFFTQSCGLVALVIVVFNSCTFGQIDYYAPENIRLFARYLYDNGEFLRAAGEYQRLLFSSQPAQHNDSVLYRIGRCYHLAGEAGMAQKYYQRLWADSISGEFSEPARCQTAHLLFEQHNYPQAIEFIQANMQSLSTPDLQERMQILWGLSYLKQRQWQLAHDHFSALKSNGNFSGLYQDTLVRLNDCAQAGLDLPYKSRYLAGLMSAMVPGSGKVYAGKPYDGLYSLLLFALTGWQAYDGFSRHGSDSVKGWIYGSIGAVLYAGNIYGSTVAVTLHNRSLEDKLIQSIQVDLRLD